MRQFLKSKMLMLILAFLLPIGIFAAVLGIFSLFNGSATVLFTDAGAQYIDFLAYQKAMLSGEASSGFFLNGMLGSEGVPLMAYYLLSPLNLLMVFLPLAALPYLFYVIVLVKLGLAGMMMYLFLDDYRRKDKEPSSKIEAILNSKWMVLVFATSYALCGFVALYFWSILWLDAILMLPLVALGIRKLVREGKVLLYIIALALAVIFNYYTGFMLGIFSILWFIYEMKVERPGKKEKIAEAEKRRFEPVKKTVLKYFGATLIAVFIGAIVLVPVALYILGGTGSKHIFLSNFMPAPRFFLPDILGQLTTGAFNGTAHYVNGLPNFFIGTVLTVLAIFFFLNKKIVQKEKRWSGILVGFLVLSMWVRTLNSVWHGGAMEFWFPTRFAFILSFVLIFLAYRGLQEYGKIGKKQIAIILGIYALIVLCSLRVNHEKIPLIVFDVIVVLLTVYLLKKKSEAKLSYVALALIQLANLGINLGFALKYLHTDEPWDPAEISEFYGENEKVIKKLKSYDPGFYRVEKTYDRSLNDAMALNYRGISQFSSTANAAAVKFLEELGYKKLDNIKIRYEYEPERTNVDEFLGVKYILSKEELPSPYELVFEEGDIKVYKNLNALPLAVIMPENVDDVAELKTLISVGGLANQGVEISNQSTDEDIKIKAKINGSGQRMVLTVAYAPGWVVYVDGKEAELEKAFGTLMAVSVEPGEHEIEFKF